jgi:hypothetical protein
MIAAASRPDRDRYSLSLPRMRRRLTPAFTPRPGSRQGGNRGNGRFTGMPPLRAA